MKKNRYYFFISLSFILLIFISMIITNMYSAEAKLSQEDALIKAFESSDSKLSKGVISVVLKEQANYSIESMNSECDRILEKISPDKDSIFKELLQESDKKSVKLLCTKGNISYNMIMGESILESTKTFDIVLKENVEDLETEKDLLKSLYGEAYSHAKLSMCLVCFYDGKLNHEQINKKIQVILKSLGAKKVEELQEEDLISVSAYSDGIEGEVISIDKKINLQIAGRYSGFDDKTYIWIGTPLINIEY